MVTGSSRSERCVSRRVRRRERPTKREVSFLDLRSVRVCASAAWGSLVDDADASAEFPGREAIFMYCSPRCYTYYFYYLLVSSY